MLPFMPFYWLASFVYILRSALNRGTVGARQALVIFAIGEERRALATSINTLSMQLPQSLGPAIAGILIGAGWYAAPFVTAAVLQGIYVGLYGRFFKALEPSFHAPKTPL
jgi:predicted MFS family arabinose efflux permease